MNNKIRKVIIIVFGMVVFQCLLYFFSKYTVSKPNILISTIDNKIPLLPNFVYFYVSWYLMLFLIP